MGRKNVTRKTWDEFRDSKLLWWINRSLHLFGWAVVIVEDKDGKVIDAYPARVRFRGFDADTEDQGFLGLTRHLDETMGELKEDVTSP